VDAADRAAWIKALNASRNFFKHADKDPNDSLDFDAKENELLLLDACLIHSEVADEPLSEANVYIGWYSVTHPSIRPLLRNNQIGDHAVRRNLSPTDLDAFRDLCGAKILIEPVKSPRGV